MQFHLHNSICDVSPNALVAPPTRPLPSPEYRALRLAGGVQVVKSMENE